MNRFSLLVISLSVLTAIVSFILFGGNYAFFTMIGYSILFSIGYRYTKTNENAIPLLVVNVAFLIFNILYIILNRLNIIDLYSVDWRLEVQLAGPLLLGLVLRKFYSSRRQRG